MHVLKVIMDKVLSEWAEKGIRTTEEAEKEKKERQEKASAGGRKNTGNPDCYVSRRRCSLHILHEPEQPDTETSQGHQTESGSVISVQN